MNKIIIPLLTFLIGCSITYAVVVNKNQTEIDARLTTAEANITKIISFLSQATQPADKK